MVKVQHLVKNKKLKTTLVSKQKYECKMAGKKGNSFSILFCNVVTPDGGPGVWAGSRVLHCTTQPGPSVAELPK